MLGVYSQKQSVCTNLWHADSLTVLYWGVCLYWKFNFQGRAIRISNILDLWVFSAKSNENAWFATTDIFHIFFCSSWILFWLMFGFVISWDKKTSVGQLEHQPNRTLGDKQQKHIVWAADPFFTFPYVGLHEASDKAECLSPRQLVWSLL